MTKHLIHDKILHIRNINNEISKSNIALITIQNKSANVYVCFVLLSFVCISAYAHAYFKSTTTKQKCKNNTNCGSAFEPGASGLSYYCASICDRFGCTRHATCVDSKPTKKKKINKTSPEPLACPLVAPSQVIQVTHLLALFVGVVSTTPVVVCTWPTQLTTPSSGEGVVVVLRIGIVPPPTQ